MNAIKVIFLLTSINIYCQVYENKFICYGPDININILNSSSGKKLYLRYKDSLINTENLKLENFRAIIGGEISGG